MSKFKTLRQFKKNTISSQKGEEAGYALVLFIILMGLGALVTSGSLQMTNSSTRTTYAVKQRSVRYLEAETSLNTAVTWLRENSVTLLSPFLRSNFYSSFDRSSTPALGTNDSDYEVPTRVLLAGTNNAPILTNDSSLATAAFPTLGDGSFNAVTEFQSLDFGQTLVRITLVDGIPDTEAKDYGPPPSAEPETDFYPVFRIDAMSATDQGTHLFAYVVGSLETAIPAGFYGEDFVDAGQDCDSYQSADGHYDPNNPNANCSVGSAGEICIGNNDTVFGSATTSDQMNPGSNCQGNICVDPACGQIGAPCEGNGCEVPALPEYEPWSTYCPTGAGNGDATAAANTSLPLTVAGDTANQRCWDTVTIENKGELVLSTTATPYYFDSLDIADAMQIQPDDPNGTVDIYVLNIVNDRINGNEVVNTSSTPKNVKIHYLGNNNIILNGNAEMHMQFIAPYAGVTISGNSDYYGSAMGLSLTLTGSGSIHYDESLAQETTSDINFRIRQMTQYYR